ncbi:OmpA family protein [Polluticoccus soli]|uniref:OmpA family protein n=1 Tax=Polluticoccus soli TaxID=3034150 RepID=UPI0023E15745|nr:OmpA family protein [Flavipsychrobacter sp. JY13-12]
MQKTAEVIIFTVMRLTALLTICFISPYIPAHAQLSDRAQYMYDLALISRAKKQNKEAIAYINTAIKERPSFVEAYSALGEWYYQARDYRNAITTFAAGSKACRDCNKTFAKPLVRCFLASYRPTEALQIIHATAPAKDPGDWVQLKEQALFMQKAMNEKWRDTVHNLGVDINSPYPEMHPYVSADTQTLYYTRKVNGIDQDFYRSLRDTCGGWYTGRNLGAPLNTAAQECAQMVSADGHYLFFTRCENKSENGWDQGGCDLFMAYTADSVWSVPESFGATINTPAYEGMPCLSADNRELYFVSDREGGYGGLDIWVSRFEDGLWQLPRNLGPTVNTPGNETAPFLHIDNHTLYFSSDGHTGLGGSDLFFARRVKDTVWTQAHNMGYPINSTANESSISVTIGGQRAYFSSDRDSVLGNYDIYDIKLPAQLQPVPVAIVKGFTYDSVGKDKLNYASIYVADASGEDLFHFVTNRGDGSYMITLPLGANYAYRADRVGYLDISDTIRLAEIDSMQVVDHNIPLLPQGYQAPITDSTILTIHFPKNSAALTDSDKAALQEAISPWLSKQGLYIMVHGYTDNTGTPMINEQLSYMRAGLVARALNEVGIDNSTVHPQGWGEADPIASNDTEEERGLNRRVEVIVRW